MSNLLLVDGYNMIGAWPILIELKDQGDLAGAREQLLRDLTDFGHYRDWRVTVVFDAYTTTCDMTTETLISGIEVCYTAQFQTADTFIEQRSLALVRTGLKVWVATSDRAQQILVQSQGAHIFSADRLHREVTKAHREQQHHHHKPSASRKGRMLEDQLDPTVRDRLLRLREGL